MAVAAGLFFRRAGGLGQDDAGIRQTARPVRRRRLRPRNESPRCARPPPSTRSSTSAAKMTDGLIDSRCRASVVDRLQENRATTGGPQPGTKDPPEKKALQEKKPSSEKPVRTPDSRCIVSATRRIPMKESVSFRLNGKPVQLEVDGDRTLLWLLRTDLGLTGTKYGCGRVSAAPAPSSSGRRRSGRASSR